MRIPPTHPGTILLEEFLEPYGISQRRLAESVAVSRRRIDEIVNGRRGITAETALRLGRFFGTTVQFWMNLQARYDSEVEQGRHMAWTMK